MSTVLLSYIVTPLVIVLVSLVIPVIVYTVRKKTAAKKRMALAACLFLLCASVNTGLLALVATKPVIVCPSEYSEFLDVDAKIRLRNDVKGLYGRNVLLFPAIIEVRYADGSSLSAHVRYLFFGSVDFSVDSDGVRSIEKPLF